MITKDLEAKVRLLEIYSKKVVRNLLAGEYRSVFKGSGMEFDEVRLYHPGDEVRSIDWNVTARTDQTHVKRYVEERELNLFFLVDLSASGTFRSSGKSKNETAAEICALLAFSAIKNNDKVGLIVFTDRIEMFIPPGKGSRHVLGIIERLVEFQPGGAGTDISAALDYFGHMTKKSSVVFLLSDFQDTGFDEALQVLNCRHDMIAVPIIDKRELVLPQAGLIELVDAETGERRVCDTDNPNVRKRFEKAARERWQELETRFDELGVDRIKVYTDDDYVQDLVRFFRARERRLTGEVMR